MALAAGAGAAIGAIGSHGDAGFDNESLKEIGSALPSGTSALAVTTSKDFVEAVREQAPEGETLTLAKDIAGEINARLSARQDVLMSLVLTEEGVAARKVVSSPSEVAVFGIAATEEGVVAGKAAATDAGVAYKAAASTDEGTAFKGGVATEGGSAEVGGVVLPDEEE